MSFFYVEDMLVLVQYAHILLNNIYLLFSIEIRIVVAQNYNRKLQLIINYVVSDILPVH